MMGILKNILLALFSVLLTFNIYADAGNEKAGASFATEKTDKIIYVDQTSANASDSNSGDQKEEPLASISKSFKIARDFLKKGISVKIEIGPGEYRESVSMKIDKDDKISRETLLIIEGDKDKKSRIIGTMTKGFESATWKAVEGVEDVYVHDWPESYGLSLGWAANIVGKMASGPTMRSEMLLLDRRVLDMRILDVYKWVDPDGAPGFGKKNREGKMVYQGNAKAGLGALDKPCTYAVSDHEKSPAEYKNKIFMRLPSGKKPADFKMIEVSRRDGTNLFTIDGKSNLIVRNLTFSYASSNGWGDAFKLRNVENSLVENCDITKNFYQGMGGLYNHSTFRKCRFNHNGGSGANGQFHYTLFEDCEFNFNNKREKLGDMPIYTGGGIKIGRETKHAVVRRCVAIGNTGAGGFWDDVYCSNLVFEKCFSYGNSGHGFFNELARPGNALYTDCVSAYNGSGIKLSSSRNPTVKNCLFVNNHRDILIIVNGRRLPRTKKEFGEFTIKDNTIYSQLDGPRKSIIWVDDKNEQLPVLNISGNKYFANKPNRFYVKDIGSMDFAAWKELLQKTACPGKRDSNSVFEKIGTKEMDFSPGSKLSKMAEAMGVPIPYKALEISRKNRVKNFEDKL